MDKKTKAPPLTAKVEEAQSPAELEIVGKSLLGKELADFLETLCHKHPNKVPPLFVGLPHTQFTELLDQMNESRLQNLKHLAETEPLQHHLTLLGHDLEKQTAEAEFQLSSIANEISLLNPLEATATDILDLEQRIAKTESDLLNISNIASKALSLAWNTSRLDLIEMLSRVKERSKGLALRLADSKRQQQIPPTGLFGLIEERLWRVFSTGESVEDLRDDEPAIEALAKFSIWYPEDYWEVGLIPRPKEHGKESSKQTKNRLEKEDVLFALAKENLKKLELNTVSDLKKARIFSRSTLLTYIENNKEKLY